MEEGLRRHLDELEAVGVGNNKINGRTRERGGSALSSRI
jgi:hypothetical protein